MQSQRLTIAAVTDDGQTISRHFGRAKYYLIITVENDQIIARKQLEKPRHQHGHHHGDDHDHDTGQVQLHEHAPEHIEAPDRHGGMFDLLHGCDVLLARGMGYGAHQGLSHIGVRPIITVIAEIDAAVQAVIDGSIEDHPEKLH